MKAAEAEKATSGKSQAEKSSFTWKIENFSKLNANKLCSDTFTVVGHNWRVLIFPKGHPKWNAADHLSLYLAMAMLPDGWHLHAKFSLSVINENDEYTVKKEIKHVFSARESVCSFISFMPLCEFCVPDRGYVIEDAVTVRAEVRVIELLDWEQTRARFKEAAARMVELSAKGNEVIREKLEEMARKQNASKL